MFDRSHDHYMRQALAEAQKSAEADEVPVGALVVRAGLVIGRAHNQVELLKDPTAHAEMIAITQAAAAVGDWRLTETTLYVTKEPCPMCAGAIVLARIPTVVFGVPDPLRGGAVSVFTILNHPQLNHRPEVVQGVLEAECREMLQASSGSGVGRRRRVFRSRTEDGDPPLCAYQPGEQRQHHHQFGIAKIVLDHAVKQQPEHDEQPATAPRRPDADRSARTARPALRRPPTTPSKTV